MNGEDVQNPLAKAKAQYEALLASQSGNIYVPLEELAVAYPFYFGPHFELIDYLEARKLTDERRALIAFTLKRIRQFLANPGFMEKARAAWTKKDGQIIINILSRAGVTFARNPLLMIRARSFHASLPDDPAVPPKYIVPIKSGLDVQKIKEEIMFNEVLWSHDTLRQDNVLFHKHTNAIALRSLANREETFTAIDGRHESKRTPLAVAFPHSIKLIEDFADEMQGGLGRIALVRLKPHSTVYRHYDGEIWLKGRNRYHLVIQSKQGSFMTAGPETRLMQEGDLFFFDNHVMHTAENRSNDWRIHAIFDMKVPENA